MIPGTISTSYLDPTMNTEATSNSVVSLKARAVTLNNANNAHLSNGSDVDLYDAFYQTLLSLPELVSSEALKDTIYQEMNAFKDPKNGELHLSPLSSKRLCYKILLEKLSRIPIYMRL